MSCKHCSRMLLRQSRGNLDFVESIKNRRINSINGSSIHNHPNHKDNRTGISRRNFSSTPNRRNDDSNNNDDNNAASSSNLGSSPAGPAAALTAATASAVLSTNHLKIQNQSSSLNNSTRASSSSSSSIKQQKSKEKHPSPDSNSDGINPSPSPNSTQPLTEQLQSQKLNHDELLKKRFFMAQSQNRVMDQSGEMKGKEKDKGKAKENELKETEIQGNRDDSSSTISKSSIPLKESFSLNLDQNKAREGNENVVGNQTVTLGSELKANSPSIIGIGNTSNPTTSNLGGTKDSFSGPNSDSNPSAGPSSGAGGASNSGGSSNSNSSSSGSGSSSNSSGAPPSPPIATEFPIGTPDVPISRPPRMDHPFNTRDFVQRLQHGGWVNGWKLDESATNLNDSRSSSISEEKGKEESSGEEKDGDSRQMQIMLAHKHDPAEAVMEAVRYLLVSRGEGVIERCLNKGDLENEAYLFSAALSELRTELQIRARNDATALRSITTLLQREVDSLSQRMSEDIAGLKHDIQVDMNNRKAESKEEANNVDQEIQDLNNRFTISLSDLKTEIEQNIKWDATRRALALVFGVTAIIVATLSLADYLTKEEKKNPNNANNSEEGSEKEDKPKTAEELGLVPNYDGDGTRFV